MPWPKAKLTKYRKTVEKARKNIGNLEDRHVRDMLATIKRARASLLDEWRNYAPPPGEPYWREYQLPGLIKSSDAIIADIERQYGSTLNLGQGEAAEMGMEDIASIVKDFEKTALSGLRLPVEQLEIMQQMGAELVMDVGNDARKQIRRSLLSAVSGQRSPWEVMKEIGGTEKGFLKDPSVFASTFYRAETIVRTELGRTFSASQQSGLEQSAKVVDGLKKEWSAELDGRTRPGHAEANGQIVEVNEPFLVAIDEKHPKEELMYPRDPGGSPGNTIS